ncbi:hypothetical protein KX058_003693 [Escherichia coli]|nr:hypothetical protein [Escherichia coli]
MNRHTQIRQAVLARLREQCGDSATFFDGLPAFIDAQELPAVAVWLSGSSDAAVADFSLLPEENGIPERTDEELMHLGEGISGGVRYGPDSQPGH